MFKHMKIIAALLPLSLGACSGMRSDNGFADMLSHPGDTFVGGYAGEVGHPYCTTPAHAYLPAQEYIYAPDPPPFVIYDVQYSGGEHPGGFVQFAKDGVTAYVHLPAPGYPGMCQKLYDATRVTEFGRVNRLRQLAALPPGDPRKKEDMDPSWMACQQEVTNDPACAGRDALAPGQAKTSSEHFEMFVHYLFHPLDVSQYAGFTRPLGHFYDYEIKDMCVRIGGCPPMKAIPMWGVEEKK